MIEDNFPEIKISQVELKNCIDEFLNSLTLKSKFTKKAYYQSLIVFFSYFQKINKFSFLIEDIEKYIIFLENQKKLKPTTINNYLAALRQLLSYMTKIQILKKNPAKRITYKLIKSNRPINYLSNNQVNQMLNSIDISTITGLRDNLLLNFILFYGILTDDIVQFNISDLTIKSRNYYKIANHQQDEIITLNKQTSTLLRKYLKMRKINDSDDEPLFISQSNNGKSLRLTKRGIYYILNKVSKLFELTQNTDVHLSIKLLYNTAGVILAGKGMPIEQLMKRLNIQHKPTAMRYYLQKKSPKRISF